MTSNTINNQNLTMSDRIYSSMSENTRSRLGRFAINFLPATIENRLIDRLRNHIYEQEEPLSAFQPQYLLPDDENLDLSTNLSESINLEGFSEEEQESIHLFLNKIEVSQLLRNSFREVIDSFKQWMEFAKTNDSYHQVFTSLIEQATATCNDGVALTLNHLYVHYLIIKEVIPEKLTPEELFIGLERMELLEQKASQVIEGLKTENPYLDEVEFRINLAIQLKDCLNLPLFLNENLYRSEELTGGQVINIKNYVLEKTRDLKEVLTNSESWKAFVKKHNPNISQEYQNISEKFATELLEIPEELTTVEYQKKVNEITQKREEELKDFFLKIAEKKLS